MAYIKGQPLARDPRASTATQRVVVKLRSDAVNVPPGVEVLGGSLADLWSNLAQRYPGVTVQPYFTEPPGGGIETLGVAPPGAESPLDQRKYLVVDVPAGTAPADVATEIRQAPTVETAYPEGGPTPPPVSPADDPRSGNQGYLNPAPEGVDARFAWDQGPVDGSGVGFVDLEQGWTLNHEELQAANIGIISGENFAYHGHGTAVLGEVCGVDNSLGGIGLAPEVTTRVVSQWRTTEKYSTADAILAAAAVMHPGDVLLLEAQTEYPTAANFVPVEVEDLVFDAIRVAVARGIVVIEAAGNGFLDLDEFVDVNGRQILNRNSPDFRDSHAIMVGAASANVPHGRLDFSNFGSRIDCFAWGEAIDTSGDGQTGQGVDTYTADFGGTSGASPIVTGCALLLQSLRLRNALPPYTPEEMRALLSDPSINTASNTADDRIGVMPNLRAVIRRERGEPIDSVPSPPVAVTE